MTWPWWKGVPVRARVGVFDDVVEAIAARDVRVIARAMDVVGQRARYRVPDPAHTVVLQHLLERWMSVPPVSVTTHW